MLACLIKETGFSVGVVKGVQVVLSALIFIFAQSVSAGTLIAKHSGKCLDVPQSSTQAGVQLIQYACHGGLNQAFDLIESGDGYHHLRLQHSGLCLQVAANSLTQGAAVVQGACEGSGYEGGGWRIEPMNAGYRLVAKHSNQCLNVSYNALYDGAQLIQWPCEGQLNEAFDIEGYPATDPNLPSPLLNATNEYGAIMMRHSGKCLEVRAQSLVNGTEIIQNTCSGLSHQRFKLSTLPDGSYQIVAEHSGQCLNIEGASPNNEARVVQWPCQNIPNGNDTFRLETRSGGHQIIANHSGLCLNLRFGSSANGGQLIQYDCEGNDNEIFTLGALGKDNGGQWSSPIVFPLVPVAAGLMSTGELLVWSAAEPMNFGGDRGVTVTAIYDPRNGRVTERRVDETGHDMFCPGTTLLPDGRFMVTGGSSAARVSIYDPITASWQNAPDMTIARAYHSATLLADGAVMVVGGSWAGGIGDKGAEVFRNNQWVQLSGVSSLPMVGDDPLGLYRSDNHMWLFSWTQDRVFQAGPSRMMHMISTVGEGSVASVGLRGNDDYAMNGSAAMFEPGKILTTGGAPAYDNGQASNNAHMIELGNQAPTVSELQPLHRPRTLHHSVVLPNGQVLILGGQEVSTLFQDGRAILTPELFDPQTGEFIPMAPSQIPRTYHSVALLMADARVFLGGGGLCGDECEYNHPDGEIFTPPYLLDAQGELRLRPKILKGPSQLSYADERAYETDKPIEAFVLIRSASSTHSVNTDQRRVPLSFTTNSDGSHLVQMPTDPGLAPPGNYMLFAIDHQGVPSQAHMVWLDSQEL